MTYNQFFILVTNQIFCFLTWQSASAWLLLQDVQPKRWKVIIISTIRPSDIFYENVDLLNDVSPNVRLPTIVHLTDSSPNRGFHLTDGLPKTLLVKMGCGWDKLGQTYPAGLRSR